MHLPSPLPEASVSNRKASLSWNSIRTSAVICASFKVSKAFLCSGLYLKTVSFLVSSTSGFALLK